MQTKTVTPRSVVFKQEGDVGTAEVVFATLGVIDKDGDVTYATDFQDGATAKIAPWGHDWGNLPTGGATIHVSPGTGVSGADEMVGSVKFLLNTDQGRNTYQTLKGLHSMGVPVEWSYGFDYASKNPADVGGKVANHLKDITVHELSPVMIGAGVNTRTLAVKGATTDDTKAATKFGDLPLYPRDRAWDAAAAEAAVRAWAGGDSLDFAKYRKAFAWYDADAADQLGSYKLQIADVTDGELWAVPRGVFAAAAALQGSRGGVDIPDADVAGVQAHLDGYYAKMREAFDDDAIVAPWSKEAKDAVAAEEQAIKDASHAALIMFQTTWASALGVSL